MTTAGRPRTSSKATIADAAAELFIENTYAGTTIDQITQRAGVSRATFFNYFTAKTDLLWVDVDAAIAQLDDECSDDLRASVLAVASGFEGTRVPLALSQSDVMGSSDEILQSGLVRVAALARVFARTASRTEAYMLAGAVSAGWLDWVRAGIGRAPLATYLGASLEA